MMTSDDAEGHADAVFLTNEPSEEQPSGETWILVANRTPAGVVTEYWNWVPWDGQRLGLGALPGFSDLSKRFQTLNA